MGGKLFVRSANRVLLVLALVWLGLCPAQAASGLGVEGSTRAYKELQAGKHPAVQALPQNELAVLKAISALKAGWPMQALEVLQQDKVLKKDPLAALIEAEAHRRQALDAVVRSGSYIQSLGAKKQGLETADLSQELIEAEVRLQAFVDQLDGIDGVPYDLLALASNVHNVFMVDKGRSRMFVYERDDSGNFQRVADEYVVTGAKAGDKQVEGDKRTPNGIYRFVGKLSGARLDRKYGPVAFPIDYPNSLDKLNHKNGNGIWMHGFDVGVGRRPPRDTRGCFALPNDRLQEMSQHVRLGNSWVVVGENFVFSDEDARQQLLDDVRSSIDVWRKDWESLDTAAYISHYHPKFRSGRKDLKAWDRYKQRINRSKQFIQLKFDKFTLIHDQNPAGFSQMVVAEFEQNYRSNNYADHTRKRLYLVRDEKNEPWRILIEEQIKL